MGLDLLPTDLLTQFYQSLELIPNDNDSYSMSGASLHLINGTLMLLERMAEEERHGVGAGAKDGLCQPARGPSQIL